MLKVPVGVVQGFTSMRQTGWVDVRGTRTCVWQLQSLMPAGLLCLFLPDVGVLHFSVCGEVHTLSSQEAFSFLAEFGTACAVLASLRIPRGLFQCEPIMHRLQLHM